MTDTGKIADSFFCAVYILGRIDLRIAQIIVVVLVKRRSNKAAEICIWKVGTVNSNTGTLNGNAIFSFAARLCYSCFGLCIRHIAVLLLLSFLSFRLGCFTLGCWFDMFPTVFCQSTLCATDRALCVHCFFRAGHFAGAYSCFFHAVLGKGRGWHKTEHHALSKQDTE